MTIEPRESSGRDQRVNEVIAEYLRAADAGQAPNRDELLARHADLADELRSFFADHDGAQRLVLPPAEAPTLAPGEAPAPSPAPGTVRYFGDYELLEEIARGGMGVVYRARQVSLNRIVALKMILSGQLASEEDVQRFRLEAQTAAALQHPNIVAIHEVGEHDGQHYFSMDFVEGKSLADLVRDNPLPPEQAARWVRTVAEAIQYAHQRGVLHRDLKPSNVLIDNFGKTGRLLWWHGTRPALPPGLEEGQIDPRYSIFSPGGNAVVAEPLVIQLDGKPVLVAAFASGGQSYTLLKDRGEGGFPVQRQGEPEAWVETIDARTGQMLWRRSLGLSGAIPRWLREYERPAMALCSIDGRSVVAVVANQRLLGLDLRTGKEDFAHDLEPLLGHAGAGNRMVPRFASLGSPPEPCVLLGFHPGGGGSNMAASADAEDVTVAAVSLKTGQPLWRKNVTTAAAAFGHPFQGGPLVVDLDGDGTPEVILTYPEPGHSGDRGAVEVLDGATGERRWLSQFPVMITAGSARDPWSQQSSSEIIQLSQVTVGPDLDGDGKREVFVASVFMSRRGVERPLVVEALSGHDGHPLWRWSHSFEGNLLGPLSWWDQVGPDGWPQLVVPVLPSWTFVLSAGTGRLAQVLGNFPEARQADLDGDGIPDLWTSHADGSLSAVRGVMPEAWRRLGKWQAVEDLDGDGVPDVIGPLGDQGASATVSGKDGRVLWQSDIRGETVLPLPLPYGDLDGDGIPDLLLFHSVEGLSAVSGRTGARSGRPSSRADRTQR
ncbi:MAG TPA: protein kinase [Gemmataceae bacterium]|nr:protein kinase [Gemmataceae bacterium]